MPEIVDARHATSTHRPPSTRTWNPSHAQQIPPTAASPPQASIGVLHLVRRQIGEEEGVGRRREEPETVAVKELEPPVTLECRQAQHPYDDINAIALPAPPRPATAVTRHCTAIHRPQARQASTAAPLTWMSCPRACPCVCHRVAVAHILSGLCAISVS